MLSPLIVPGVHPRYMLSPLLLWLLWEAVYIENACGALDIIGLFSSGWLPEQWSQILRNGIPEVWKRSGSLPLWSP